jgi:hypothetical protein
VQHKLLHHEGEQAGIGATGCGRAALVSLGLLSDHRVDCVNVEAFLQADVVPL